MTVSTTVSKIAYVPDGVQTVFTFPNFPCLQTSDLKVNLDGTQVVAGFVTTLYADGTGYVTFTPAPVGSVLTLYREVPLTQAVDLGLNNALVEPTLELMSDKLTMADQQLQEQISRALVLNIADSNAVSLELPPPVDEYLLGWNFNSGTGKFKLVSTEGTPGPQGEPGSMTGPVTSVLNRIAAFNNLVGTLVKDSGILYTDVVLGPATATDKAVALYNGATGKLLKDGIAPGASGNVLKSDGTNWTSAAPSSSGPTQLTDQTLTTGGTVSVAHSLGVKPKMLESRLVCVTAEAGYTAGEEVKADVVNNGSTINGHTVWVDATNVNVRFNNNVTMYTIFHKTTGNPTNLTNANWKLRMYVQ